MNDQEQKPKSNEKTPYTPPEVVRVNLRPEEAVLGHCKALNAHGPAGSCGVTCPTLGS